VLVSPAEAVADYPVVVVGEADARALSHGKPLAATGIEGPVAVLDEGGRLLAMVEDRETAARPLVVLAPANAGDQD